MYLCIDWGNTRVKAALFQEGTLANTFNFSEEEAIMELVKLAEQYKPEATILCSVALHPPELKMLLQERSQLLLLQPGTPLPILNAYHSPESLGMDRLALVVGAQTEYPRQNTLVVNVGTAITYNFIQKNTTFRGGNISPGIHQRFRALHEFTDQLPWIELTGDIPLLGYDTATSIRSGVIWGVAAEIDGFLNLYREQYPDLNAVLTGGDASLFANKLKNRIFADSQLLMKGLNTILQHNVR